MKRFVRSAPAILCFIIAMCATYDNPYDPNTKQPLPLSPSDLRVTIIDRTAIRLDFSYEYVGNNVLRIFRNDSMIAECIGDAHFVDSRGIEQDRRYWYRIVGHNGNGDSKGPVDTALFVFAPEIRITVQDDTTHQDTVLLEGTVADASGIDIMMIDSIPVSVIFNRWRYLRPLENDTNSIEIYARDRSAFKADTTITIKLIH